MYSTFPCDMSSTHSSPLCSSTLVDPHLSSALPYDSFDKLTPALPSPPSPAPRPHSSTEFSTCTHTSLPSSLDEDDLLSYDIDRKLTEMGGESTIEGAEQEKQRSKTRRKEKKKKKSSEKKKNERNVFELLFGSVGQAFQSVANEIWRGTVMQVESGVTSTSVRPMWSEVNFNRDLDIWNRYLLYISILCTFVWGVRCMGLGADAYAC